jgi:hypothetical protein
MGKDESDGFVLAVDRRFEDLDQIWSTNTLGKSRAMDARPTRSANGEMELRFPAAFAFVPASYVGEMVIG